MSYGRWTTQQLLDKEVALRKERDDLAIRHKYALLADERDIAKGLHKLWKEREDALREVREVLKARGVKIARAL